MGALLLKMGRAAMASAVVVGGFCASVAQAQEVQTLAPTAAADNSPPLVDAAAAETGPADTPAAPALDHIPAGTVIEIRVDEPVNSKTHKTGDWYAISLSRPIMLGDAVLLPAGTPGRGQVVHSARSSWGGKAGELILGARYLDFNGKQVALRAMKLGGVGGNNEGLAFAAVVAGGLVATPLVFALNGKNADIEAGMLATAKLSADLFPEPAAAPAAPEVLPDAEPPADAAPMTEDVKAEEINSVPTKQEDL